MPHLHFSRPEFDRRLAAARASLEREGFDGIVLFRQDSMYYLTGYDTSGYTMFQGMYLGADGALALLTRTADRIQSRETSIVEDIRIWHDREDASPGDDLRAMLRTTGVGGSASASSTTPTVSPASARRWSTRRSTDSASSSTLPTSCGCCDWSRARRSLRTCAGRVRSATASSR